MYGPFKPLNPISSPLKGRVAVTVPVPNVTETTLCVANAPPSYQVATHHVVARLHYGEADADINAIQCYASSIR